MNKWVKYNFIPQSSKKLLKKGDEIDEEYLKSILSDEMYLKAKNKALNILSKADQAVKKIREKLSNDCCKKLIININVNPILVLFLLFYFSNYSHV